RFDSLPSFLTPPSSRKISASSVSKTRVLLVSGFLPANFALGHTLWYAGSLWKIYIQKVRSSKGASRGSGGMQLGIYLHRARERRRGDEVYGGTGIIATPGQGSVDERTANWENNARMTWRTALERR